MSSQLTSLVPIFDGSMLRHGRDVRSTWAKVTSLTDKTLRCHVWFLSDKSNKDLYSSWWEVVTLEYFKYERNTLNGSDRGWMGR